MTLSCCRTLGTFLSRWNPPLASGVISVTKEGRLGERKGRPEGERLGKGVGSQLRPHARLWMEKTQSWVIIPTMFEAAVDVCLGWGGF